jgi:hypothetical protein
MSLMKTEAMSQPLFSISNLVDTSDRNAAVIDFHMDGDRILNGTNTH